MAPTSIRKVVRWLPAAAVTLASGYLGVLVGIGRLLDRREGEGTGPGGAARASTQSDPNDPLVRAS